MKFDPEQFILDMPAGSNAAEVLVTIQNDGFDIHNGFLIELTEDEAYSNMWLTIFPSMTTADKWIVLEQAGDSDHPQYEFISNRVNF